MKIEIKHRYSGEVLFSHEQENNSLKITLQLAVSKKINLSGSNLRGSNLSYANLGGSVGKSESLQIGKYRLVINEDICWGGCTKKTLQEWLDYSGDELHLDDKSHLETVTKPFIRMVIAARREGV